MTTTQKPNPSSQSTASTNPSTSTQPPAITITGLTKTFTTSGGDTVRAVDGLDLTIRPGEIVAFLGPNGAGKTTTLDLVLGLTEPNSGSVSVYGMNPRAAARTGRMGAVLQTGGLLDDFTVEETVRVVAGLYGSNDRVDAVLERTDIARIADHKVSRCSGGEQQRLKFALAILPDPDLIILDEPTTGMDVESRRTFWATMRADAAHGRTILFATHYLEEADAFADRIVMVAGGRIVADGPIAEIRAQAARRVVSAVIGEADLHTTLANPDVELVDQRGGRSFLAADNSDALTRHLMIDTDAHTFEISGYTLEDVFVRLTGA